MKKEAREVTDNPDIYHCYKCKSKFTDPRELREHLNVFHPGWQYQKISKLGIHRVK